MLHQPVLAQEILRAFKEMLRPPRTLLEGTFGRGGHTRLLLDAFPDAVVTSFDQDEEAIVYAREHFADFISTKRLHLIHEDFAKLGELKLGTFDGALLDLGVSSPQFDDAARGFSFQFEGPLDMRMDLRLRQTAGDVVNTFSEKELSDIFYHYGDVRHPNRVVRAIVHDRKEKHFTTTRELAGLIERVDGVKRVRGKTISSATQYFMALRIAVNGELDALKSFLAAMPSTLNDGGRCAVISFHSLEDRIVKHTFREWSQSIGSPVNKKIIEASEDEVRDNPRARSAKLRVFQKGGVE